MPVIKWLKPSTLYRPRGYVHATLSQGSHVLHTSGQLATDMDGMVQFPGDYAAQAELAIRNVVSAIEAGGAGVADIARLSIYVAGLTDETLSETFVGIMRAAKEVDLRIPANSVLGVAALSFGALVEIDAVAYISSATD